MNALAKHKTIAAAIFVGGLCAALRVSQAQSEISPERKEYADKIRENYNFCFGKDKLSAPGNPSVEGHVFLQPGAFPNAKYCAHCHEQAYSDWREALHSNSFRTPFYRT